MKVLQLVLFLGMWAITTSMTVEKSDNDMALSKTLETNGEMEAEYFDGKLPNIDGDFVGATEYTADAFPRVKPELLSNAIDANKTENVADKITKFFHHVYGMLLKLPPLM